MIYLSLHLGENSLSIVGDLCNLALFATKILDFALADWNPKSKIFGGNEYEIEYLL